MVIYPVDTVRLFRAKLMVYGIFTYVGNSKV